MKTIHGTLIHLAQADEFDFIVHGGNYFYTMGAVGGGRGSIVHQTPNIENRMEENLELPKIGAGIGNGIDAVFLGWFRPFKAWSSVGDALGYRMMTRWGGRVVEELA